ncbi:hypothetical protein UFOVP777_13 [uncultured Caudovirales phage]|uniref:Uncharacterized protein n=1 Tax=uncultured Caudovirales phage TaxID=2100421 RepID=A0A6J5NSM4_9CAUD|nr:hypothetical protein UFOVP777_13 [uncultured Caudovirales phage]
MPSNFRSLARGVKLTVQHLTNPTGALAQDLGTAALEQAQQQAPMRFQWVVGSVNSRMFETTSNKLCLPFLLPPFQQDFDNATYRPPVYRVTLNEFSIAWDQRAEPYGITDQYAATAEGFISNIDMTRLNLSVKLCEKTPTKLGGLAIDRTEVLSLDISGVEAFSDPTFRRNPIYIDGLYIPLNPYKTYWWEVSCPGLFKAPPADDTLALPSFTIHCKCLSPLFTRDSTSVGFPIQNIPQVHGGTKQTSPVVMPAIAVDSLINGDTDLQATFGKLDQAFLDRLKSGYGDTPGLESDTFPAEQLNKDAGYCMIAVPMWQGYNDQRASETALAGLPYVAAPWKTDTEDRRLLVVPDGFVLHHAFAVWSLNAPPCVLTGGNAAWGMYPTSATFYNRVGIGLHNGTHGDNYRFQQVAFTEWTPPTAGLSEVDTYSPDPTGAIPNFWSVQHIPLSSDNIGNQRSYFTTGQPFFMGRATEKTATRLDTGNMPAAFGGAAYAPPATDGAENTLEIRWQMEDTVQGLDHAAGLDDVHIGTGGHWVLLIGKSTLHA